MITGLHHVTAIASDPQRNVDFYAGVLGLRLVKRTVNFDDPSAYHLYYGDGTGRPGTIVTFFYWPGFASAGRLGNGQMAAITFSAPTSSLGFWANRLAQHGVTTERSTRFGAEVIAFADPDRIPVEIVGVADDERPGWSGADIPREFALRGLFAATLSLREMAPTAELLTQTMGFTRLGEDGGRTRFAVGAHAPGELVDLIVNPALSRGQDGAGTIHHVAWRVAGDAEQKVFRGALQGGGLTVSPVRDRTYFRSIYYREPGGILFEIATDVPGFGVDESPDALGSALKLPPQFEPFRDQIERALPPLRTAPAAA